MKAVLIGVALAAAAAAAAPIAIRTIVVSVHDPQGKLIPNLRPDNFAVYENGVRQRDVTVDVAHAPITLAVVVEGGGRYQAVKKILATEIPYLVRPLVDALAPDDKVGAFAYTGALRTLADFPQAHKALDAVLAGVPEPAFAEANLFDALVALFDRMRTVEGRKAVLLISTGLDTFSLATFEDVLAAAQRSGTPVYAISLAGAVERTLVGSTGPIAKINWARAKEQLRTLARSSGGRAYMRDLEFDVLAVYDDMMEHLRVRYVLKYASSTAKADASGIRVELVDPKTGAALRVTDAAGRSVTPTVTISQADRPEP
jgi:Ca-activated chloride channel family protein